MIDDHDDHHDDVIDNDAAKPADDSADDEVGYCKPPKAHQFQKGRSGNPKGRKKGSRGLKTDLKAELNSRVPVTENGKTKNLTKQQVVLKALVAKAAKGDTRASAQVLAMSMQMFGIEDERTDRTDLTPAELSILESYMRGDLREPLLLEDASDNASDDFAPQTDVSGNGNHNNVINPTLPDEESDDEPTR